MALNFPNRFKLWNTSVNKFDNKKVIHEAITWTYKSWPKDGSEYSTRSRRGSATAAVQCLTVSSLGIRASPMTFCIRCPTSAALLTTWMRWNNDCCGKSKRRDMWRQTWGDRKLKNSGSNWTWKWTQSIKGCWRRSAWEASTTICCSGGSYYMTKRGRMVLILDWRGRACNRHTRRQEVVAAL